MSDSALRGRPALPDRDPVGRGAARARGGARGSRDSRSVPVRRVSQGSGVMMLTDAEIREMASLGADAGVEVSLFLGPRGAWDTGGQSLATRGRGRVARGRARDRGVRRGGASEASRSASARSSSPISACSRRSAGCGATGELPADPRPQDLRAPAVREPGVGTHARGARRDDDQRRDRPLASRARRAARRVLSTARRLRRGARRPGRLRALLRRAGDHPRSPRPST